MEKKLTESIEDYIETIYLESQKHGKGVRITDVALELKVSKASANDAVRKLKELGYVEHERYGQIYLTEIGTNRAVKVLSESRVTFLGFCALPSFQFTNVYLESIPVIHGDTSFSW